MANNPMTDAALAELDRQYGRAESETGTKIDLAVAMNAAYLAYPALRQRLLDAEARLAEEERKRDVYHAALSEIYYRAIPMNEDSGHSTIAHIAADAMRGRNGNPLADLVATLRGALEETRKDNEELDGTDAAHPAWWRGNDAGVAQVCAQINAILDGADVFGTAAEPWESTRRRVAEARKDSERLRWILCNCELVHAGKLRNGNPVYLESLEELDAARGTK